MAKKPNALAKGRATSTSCGGRLFGRNAFQRIVIRFLEYNPQAHAKH